MSESEQLTDEEIANGLAVERLLGLDVEDLEQLRRAVGRLRTQLNNCCLSRDGAQLKLRAERTGVEAANRRANAAETLLSNQRVEIDQLHTRAEQAERALEQGAEVAEDREREIAQLRAVIDDMQNEFRQISLILGGPDTTQPALHLVQQAAAQQEAERANRYHVKLGQAEAEVVRLREALQRIADDERVRTPWAANIARAALAGQEEAEP